MVASQSLGIDTIHSWRSKNDFPVIFHTETLPPRPRLAVGNDRLDMGGALGAVAGADAEVIVALDRHADERCDRVGKLSGGVGLFGVDKGSSIRMVGFIIFMLGLKFADRFFFQRILTRCCCTTESFLCAALP